MKRILNNNLFASISLVIQPEVAMVAFLRVCKVERPINLFHRFDSNRKFYIFIGIRVIFIRAKSFNTTEPQNHCLWRLGVFHILTKWLSHRFLYVVSLVVTSEQKLCCITSLTPNLKHSDTVTSHINKMPFLRWKSRLQLSCQRSPWHFISDLNGVCCCRCGRANTQPYFLMSSALHNTSLFLSCLYTYLRY